VHRIVQSTDLQSDLNLDEYDFQMLIFRLEHFYKIEFGTDEIQDIKIVKDLGELITKKESSANWSEPNLYAASF
jgi:acyl carrier protein